MNLSTVYMHDCANPKYLLGIEEKVLEIVVPADILQFYSIERIYF